MLFGATGLLLLAAAAVTPAGASTAATTFAPAGTALSIVGAGFGLTNLAAGYGTWRFTAWGRLGLFVVVGSALGGLLLLPAAPPVGLAQIGVNGAVAWYLPTASSTLGSGGLADYAGLTRRSSARPG